MLKMASEVREPTFLILTALAARPLHGYGIIQEVSSITKGKVTIRVGSLYGMLDRLVQEGLVGPEKEEIVDGRLRRYYALTSEGSALLTSHATQMASVSKEALRRLRVSPSIA
jgi:DNA-binding PadR family transcriptional regulator